MARQLRQNVDVARDQSVFSKDADRVPEFSDDLEATPRDLQFAFDRLITIGHSAHHQQLRRPFR